MNKKLIVIILLVIVAGGGIYYFSSGTKQAAFDPSNAVYMVDNQLVALQNGKSEIEAAPGSASKIITRLFGTPVSGDINGDGVPDAAVILVRDSGGSGTFYYVAAALALNGTKGTNAILLGDRIAPQSLEVRPNGQIVANYAERKPGEPMTASPSVGVSKYLVVRGGTLEAAQVAVPGGRCGGNMLNAPVCGAGYHCAPEPGSHLPFGDVGGICVAN